MIAGLALLGAALVDIGRGLQLRPDAAGGLFEVWQGSCGQRTGATHLGQQLWVLLRAIDAELEMQVRTGGPAGRAHKTDRLTLADRLALLHSDLAQVRIDCFLIL